MAGLQPGLVHPEPTEVIPDGEEPRIRSDPTAGVRVEFGHPRAHTVGIEDVVPRAVQRVRDVDAPLLTSTIWGRRRAGVRRRRVRGPVHDAAEADRAGLAG